MNHIVRNFYRQYCSVVPFRNKLPNYPENKTFTNKPNYKQHKIVSENWHHNQYRNDCFILNTNESKHNDEQEIKPNKINFAEVGFSQELLEAMWMLKYSLPTEIQAKSFKPIMEGKNVIMNAESGCGKTLAYLVPIIQNILHWKSGVPQDFNNPFAVVITPTKELASQVANIGQTLCEYLNINVAAYTGEYIKQQVINPPVEYCDLVVSSLGSYSKLVATGVFKTTNVRHIVLDEADTLLEDSFIDQLTHLLKKFTFKLEEKASLSGCQLTLASAFLPPGLRDKVVSFAEPQSFCTIRTPKVHRLLPHVLHRFNLMRRTQKPGELFKLVKAEMKLNRSLIIFSNKRTTCDYVSSILLENNVECINYNQNSLIDINDYLDGNINILCCTQLVARGLDTTKTSHVINYDFPLSTAEYIRRAGRTGRIGSPSSGTVTNFVSSERDIQVVQEIERASRNNEELHNFDVYRYNKKNV